MVEVVVVVMVVVVVVVVVELCLRGCSCPCQKLNGHYWTRQAAKHGNTVRGSNDTHGPGVQYHC